MQLQLLLLPLLTPPLLLLLLLPPLPPRPPLRLLTLPLRLLLLPLLRLPLLLTLLLLLQLRPLRLPSNSSELRAARKGKKQGRFGALFLD